MTCLMPRGLAIDSGGVDLLRVFARCDPHLERQLIASQDVGRIAALVLMQGSRWYEMTLDLAADRLSTLQEAEVRCRVMGGQTAVFCQTGHLTKDTAWCCDCLGSGSGGSGSAWTLPGEGQRQAVSIADTRKLLPDHLTYSQWFTIELRKEQQRQASARVT